MKIYVASSWRNDQQPDVVHALRQAGHAVYDFKGSRLGFADATAAPSHPREEGNGGFRWTDIDPNWKSWSPDQFRKALENSVAIHGLARDYAALTTCDACVLVMPCGRSAHLEAGHVLGAGGKLIILLADGEPELMYGMAHALCISMEEVIEQLASGT